MTITPLGDRAWLIAVAATVDDVALARVQQVTQAVRQAALSGVRELVPAATSVAVVLDGSIARGDVRAKLDAMLVGLPPPSPVPEGEEREVPVYYGASEGPDLAHVAECAGLSPAEVVRQHTSVQYRVQAVGFAPGFPYLGGLPECLHAPRRATPRPRVPAGSVGIGGGQTGIYPLETPGGWQLIGRTPRPIFEVSAQPPAWLQAGDRVTFRAITRAEFQQWARDVEAARQACAVPVRHAPTGGIIEVVRPGVQTTVQDLGRPGWAAQGVPAGGALDPLALQIANLLVGNLPTAAALEWARQGPVLHFREDRVVAVTGVQLADGSSWRPRLVRAGDNLDLRQASSGMRGYLAIAGGLDVPEILWSRSTCLAARFGGFRGRAVRAGDLLPVGEPRITSVTGRWSTGPLWRTELPHATIRVVPGPQSERFSTLAWRLFTEGVFRIRPESDRMAVRLDGPKLLLDQTEELISAPVATGSIQVPPDGVPVVLLADRQTIGGYPQIGYAVHADLAKLAQLTPGASLRFVEVSYADAERLDREQAADLGFLRIGVASRLT